jgi:hypothetical protein
MFFTPMLQLLLPALLVLCFGSGLLTAQDVAQPPSTTKAPSNPAQTTKAPSAQPTANKSEAEPPADGQLPPEAHPWGRFPVGSSKIVRVTSESLDAAGHVLNTTVTETKSTLIEATDQEYKLRVESSVEVAGKKFIHPAQVTRHTYWGELATSAPTGLRKVSTSEIHLNGKKIACEVRQAINDRDGKRQQTTIHYTANQFPYLLKRESSITAADAPATTTTVEVISNDLLFRVAGIHRPVAFVLTNYQGPKNSSTTIEIQSAEVPGGVVNHSAQEKDAAGVVTRRTSLELVEYHIGSETAEEAVSPGRRRWLRQQRREMNSRRDR